MVVVIYRISSPNTAKVYIGSYDGNVKKRLSVHKSYYKRYITGKSNCRYSSFSVIDAGDARIEVLEIVPDPSMRDSLESIHIRWNNSVNVNKPGNWKALTPKEYQKNYRIQHKKGKYNRSWLKQLAKDF